MAEFPYTPKVSSVDPFFAKIQSTGIPPKVTLKYIESLGFKSKSDRYLSGLLKSLGFTDASGVPRERWKVYRSQEQSRTEFAAALRETYSGLFSMYPDAHRKDDEALRNFFISNTSVGEGAVGMMVSTFKALCQLADFESSYAPSPAIPVAATPSPVAAAGAVKLAESTTTSQGIVVNLNIQLTLPETKESSVYDSIFESLKKHLLS